MNIPADLTMESAAWIRAEIATSNARTAAALTSEVNLVDEWANGVFAVLLDLVPALLRRWPDLANEVEGPWSKAARAFDLVEQHGPLSGVEETAEALEARKILYRILELGAVCKTAREQPGRRAASRRA